MWDRYVKGSPIYTLQATSREVEGLRARLSAQVAANGIEALVADGTAARDFVCFASSYVADDADRLQWPPLLRLLRVEEKELTKYPELYDGVERALRALGRDVITTRRGRRFLGTFLREGGLPANIGNLADLVVLAAEEFGWNALRDDGVRELATSAVSRRATGSAAAILASPEGRSALSDLFATAAEARALLIGSGVDPVTLHGPEDVRAALTRARIPLPAVRNVSLLLGVLASFTQEGTLRVPLLAPLRLAARERGGALELLIHLDLDVLSQSELPDLVTHVSLAAEPCTGGRARTLVRRLGKKFSHAHTGESSAEWVRTGAQSPSRVDAYFAGEGGIAQIVPIATVEWECADELWFTPAGDLLAEMRETLQPGEVFLVVSWRDVELVGQGGVRVRRLNAPVGARSAWTVDAAAAGFLHIRANGIESAVECGTRALAVAVLQSPSIVGLPKRFVRSLPDLALPEGVSASIEVSRPGGLPGAPLTLSGASGYVRLSSDPNVRLLLGHVRVRIRAEDGRSWSASWFVLPPRFALLPHPGWVEIDSLGLAVAHVVGGTWATSESGRPRIEATEGETRVELFVRAEDGEIVKLPIDVSPRALRIWADHSLTKTFSATPPPTLTERMVHEGACVEFGGAPGSELTIRSPTGDSLIQLTKRSNQRVFVGLSELFHGQWRRGEPNMRFAAAVVPSGETTAFAIHIPRLAAPDSRLADDGSLALDFALDGRDVPAKAAIAFFSIGQPFSPPAFVPTELGPQRFETRLGATDVPTEPGMYILFLVDASVDPPRPMSHGKRIAVPLSLETPPVPPHLGVLESALWERDARALLAALKATGSSPGFEVFAEAFIKATLLRAPYRLETFWLWEIVGKRAPWLVLTCAARLSGAEQEAWLSTWAQQIVGFSWLRVTRADVQCFAQTMPARSTEEKLSLFEKASVVYPMLQSTEHLLIEGIVRGESAILMDALRRADVNAEAGVDVLQSPATFALPSGGAAESWLRGSELDPDVALLIEETLGTQIMHGARALAVRALFMRRELPGGHLELQLRSHDPWGQRLIEWIKRQWVPLATNLVAHRIHGLDRECALAALTLVDHRNGRHNVSPSTFNHIMELERMAPKLLDSWITAVCLREEKSP